MTEQIEHIIENTITFESLIIILKQEYDMPITKQTIQMIYDELYLKPKN